MKFFVIFYLLFFSACSVKEYTLFQEDEPSSVQNLNISYKEKIIPNDVLVINIYNNGEKTNKVNEFLVDEDGTIVVPILSEIRVSGSTIQELNSRLTQRYKKYLTNPKIKTRLKNHKVYVLGEVKTEGVLNIENSEISIIEVIAKAGGLSNDALRSRIRIISENNGKYQMRSLNLTKLSSLNLNNLMVKHKSIVYVEPKSSKALKVAIDDYSPVLQAISTILGTYLLIGGK